MTRNFFTHDFHIVIFPLAIYMWIYVDFKAESHLTLLPDVRDVKKKKDLWILNFGITTGTSMKNDRK